MLILFLLDRSAASVGTTDATPTSGGVVPDPSSTLSLPEAVLVHYGEKQARTGQWESATSGVKPELVDDPLLTDAEVKKMKEYFSGLFKDTNVRILSPSPCLFSRVWLVATECLCVCAATHGEIQGEV